MRLIVCDRCGKKMSDEDMNHTMTVCRRMTDGGKMLMMHCDRIRLVSKGELKAEHDIDLCDTCKASFVSWFGKIGLYEER